LVICAGFIGTVIWSLFDAGWDFWPLFSRLMFPAGLFAALILTLPAIRKYQFQIAPSAPAYALVV
jgi:quinate dehydrogenase (quinone)